MKSRWLNELDMREEYTRQIFLFALLIFMSACTSSNPAWEYMPDMADSPALKAQKYDENLPHHRAMLEPVEGTVPRGFQPYPYRGDPQGAAVNLKNPLPRTEAVLNAGKEKFNIYCAVCHGPTGEGNGSVVPPFPRPPSLHSDKVRGWSDGEIFHVITEGQNIMPSYASQVEAEGRWAIIHYVRTLQRAQYPSNEDVESYQRYRKERKER